MHDLPVYIFFFRFGFMFYFFVGSSWCIRHKSRQTEWERERGWYIHTHSFGQLAEAKKFNETRVVHFEIYRDFHSIQRPTTHSNMIWAFTPMDRLKNERTVSFFFSFLFEIYWIILSGLDKRNNKTATASEQQA